MRSLVCALLVVMAGNVFATNARVIQLASNYGYDSCKVIAFRAQDSTVTLTAKTFPYNGTLTLADTVSYVIVYKWFEGDTVGSSGEGWNGPYLVGRQNVSVTAMAANVIADTNLAATGTAEIADASGDSTWSVTATTIASRNVRVYGMADTITAKIADASGDSTWSTTATAIANRNVRTYGMADTITAKIANAAGDSTWSTTVTAIADRNVRTYGMADTIRQKIADASADSTWSATVTSVANRTVTTNALANDAITAASIQAAAITSSEAPNLDAAISTRSTLAATDNIGINWADVSNPTTTLGLTGTTIGTVTTTGAVTTVNGLAANVITAASINSDAITDAKISTAAGTEIGTAVWNIPYATAFTTASMGDSANNNGFYGQGATAASIADAVWDEDSTGHMADALNMAVIASATAAGTTPPTAAQIADAVWDEDSAAHFSGTKMGYFNAAGLKPTTNGRTATLDANGYVTYGNAAPPSAATIAGEVWSATGRDLSTSPPTDAEIADAVWDEDSTGHYTSPNMAFVAAQTAAGTTPPTVAQIWTYGTRVLTDTTNISKVATDAAAKTWATSTRTLSDTTNISKVATDAAAKTWATSTRTLSDTTNISKLATDAAAKTWATAIGTKLVTTSVISNDAISAAALSTAAGDEIADHVWDEDSVTHVASGTMGSSASQTSVPTLTPATIWAYSPRVLTSGAVTATIDSEQVYHIAAKALHDSSAIFTTDTAIDYRIIARVVGDSLLRIVATSILNDTAGVAGDFASSFSEYRNAIKRRCGVEISNTAWLADTIMNDFIKEAVAAVNPYIMGRKITDTITTTFQENTYKIDSNIIGLFSVSWIKNDSVKGLLNVPRGIWYQQDHRTTKGQTDAFLRRPSYYDFMDGYVSVAPAPNIVGDRLVITGWSRIPNLASATSISLIPQQYRATILEYAAWKVAEAKQHPMATAFHANFSESLGRLEGMLNRTGVKK